MMKKTNPIPTPDPANDTVAIPAPINLAAVNNILLNNNNNKKKENNKLNF